MVQSHALERQKGDGSRSANGDQMVADRWESKDERAETVTTFWPQDIDKLEVSRRRKEALHSALRRHEGETQHESFHEETKSRGQQNHAEWRRRMVGIYAAQLDLTPHQKRRARHLVMDVLDINSFGPYSTEQVILATINIVCREDGRWIEDEQQFRDAADGEELEMHLLRSLRTQVKNRL